MDLRWARLSEMNLKGADLREANLQEATFKEYNSKGDLLEAKGLTVEQLAEAFWDGTTKWPEGFSPPALRRLPQKTKDVLGVVQT